MERRDEEEVEKGAMWEGGMMGRGEEKEDDKEDAR